jgi:Signal transduction histidine kinase
MHTKHRFQKLACYLLLSLSCATAFAQNSIEKHYLFTHYNTQNGLINNVIYSMAQDEHGFVWIGSGLGLTRFDGKTFYHKAVPEIYDNAALVQHVETIGTGHIVCTAQMQGVFEQMEDGSFQNYYMQPKRIGLNVFHAVRQRPGGELLAMSASLISKVEDNNIGTLYSHDKDLTVFNTIDFDAHNTIWFGGIQGVGYLESSEEGLRPIFLPELEGQYIVKILFDKQGVLHVGTARGYYRIVFDKPYRPQSKYTISQPFDAVSTTAVNHLYIDREQSLWISTSGSGTYRTKNNDITLHLTTNNGLISASVICMLQDKEGNYWFGTNSGLSVVADFDSYMLAENGKLFQNTRDIIPDAFGRLWMPGAASFCVYEDGQVRQLDMSKAFVEMRGVRNVTIDAQSVMWLFNRSELYKIKLTEPLPDMRKIEKVADFSRYNPMQIRSIATDENGVWLCARTKILQYHHKRVRPVHFNHADSSSLYPRAVVQDHLGYYWIGNFSNGLYRASLKENSKDRVVFDDVKVYKSLKRDSSFVTAWIMDLAIDKEGHLWEPSVYTGIYKHTLDSTGVVASTLYSIENGLLSNMVSGVDCRADGRIWIYTQNGICILTQDAEGREYFEYIDKTDGINGIPAISVEQGELLFTLTDEAFFVTPNKISGDIKENIPAVVITGLSVNGVDQTSWVYRNETLPLGHTQNNLSFDFSSVTFRLADNIKYQYKLEGPYQDWSEPSDRGFVEYSALRNGKYTFKVRAALSGGLTGEESIFTFKIRPAYFQTIWFYLLCCVLVLALLYSFYQTKMRQALKVERLRLRIAADLHDDMGSTLSSIFLMSGMVGSADKQARLLEVLGRISENSRDILGSMDDIIWSVNPQDDSLGSLIVRLREYAIPVCEAKGITFSIQVEEAARHTRLGMDERRNIFLIAKEAVNNAVKHSGCSQLEVFFTVYHKRIELSVIDNGRGFDLQAPSSRNGLVNMRRRAGQIASELQMISEKGKGTSVFLWVKNHIFI